MDVTLTKRSLEEYRRLRAMDATLADAAGYLRSGAIDLCTFQEVLLSFYPGDDLTSRLIESFMADDPSALRNTVSHTVRNWVSGRTAPTEREDVFHIAFTLGFTEAQTARLLGLISDYGIHFRDRHDAVYAWFLRSGRTYLEAADFYKGLPPIPEVGDSSSTDTTHGMENVFLHIQTEEELRECCIRLGPSFGVFHNHAYRYFERYLRQLTRPVSAVGDEDAYSLDTVMERYLSLKMPSGRNRAGYSTVQKLIKQNWPNTTALKDIRSRRQDVPRKLLLLLYVITENVVDSDYSELDEPYITRDERLEGHWNCLNALLTDCGMPLLNPRNATDWLILYALTAGDDEPMSERMEKVIEKLFADL